MRTLTIRFCIDDAHLEEIQIEAPTGVSLRNLIKDAKRGLNRHSACGGSRQSDTIHGIVN